MADDDDVAAAILAQDMPEPRERVSEWSELREALARVEDAIRFNTAATIAVAGGKPGHVKPVMRPVTAIDRLRRAAALESYRRLSSFLTGRNDE